MNKITEKSIRLDAKKGYLWHIDQDYLVKISGRGWSYVGITLYEKKKLFGFIPYKKLVVNDLHSYNKYRSVMLSSDLKITRKVNIRKWIINSFNDYIDIMDDDIKFWETEHE